MGHATSHQTGFNETRYRLELNKQNYEVELKGVMGKIQDVETEKYKVEMQLGNELAELETKVGSPRPLAAINAFAFQNFLTIFVKGLKISIPRLWYK